MHKIANRGVVVSCFDSFIYSPWKSKLLFYEIVQVKSFAEIFHTPISIISWVVSFSLIITRQQSVRHYLSIHVVSSGNTWTRAMLGAMLGGHSGSAHRDPGLSRSFPSEMKCDRSVVMMKARKPCSLVSCIVGHCSMISNFSACVLLYRSAIDPSILTWRNNQTDLLDFKVAKVKSLCMEGGVDGFKRMIFIARDPVAALWSQFHLSLTLNHVGNFKGFVPDRWLKWREFCLREASGWGRQWNNIVYPFLTKHKNSYLLLRYEDLVTDRDRCASELQRAAAFVGNPWDELVGDRRGNGATNSRNHYSGKGEVRSQCAMIHADRMNIHRSADVNISDSSHPQQPVNYLAQSFVLMPQLACEIYNLTTAIYTYFGYKPYNGEVLC